MKKRLTVSFVIEKVIIFIPILLFFILLILNKFVSIDPMLSYLKDDVLDNESKLSMLISLNSVLVGFYAAIFTIIATSNMSAIKIIVRKNLGKNLIKYFLSALISACSFMYFTLVPEFFLLNNILILVYSLIFLTTIIMGTRFIYTIIKMFKFNLDVLKLEIQQEDEVQNKKIKKRNDSALESLKQEAISKNNNR